MQWSLFLFILMGQCFILTCHLYEYHYIKKKKTWDEAQKYCREKYTDLAKVFDMVDIRRLCNSTQHQTEAWIGLYNNTEGNRMWHWSLPGVKYIENNSSWNLSQRISKDGQGNCGRERDKWADAACDHPMWFVCYDEISKDNTTLRLINRTMNWTQAQSYCRLNHTDLASGPDQVEGKEMKNLKKSAGSPMSVWIGLFRDSWRWSDGSDSSFRYWDRELFNDGQSNKTCAMTLLNRSGKWSSDECNNTKPFFCYDDKLILIDKNMTWREALGYCRKFHRDLVSITDPQEQGWVQEKAKNASSPFVWLGLRYSCPLDLWFWVSDKLVCYEKWGREGKTEECDMAVGMDRGGQHEWFSWRENETYNFICSKQ